MSHYAEGIVKYLDPDRKYIKAILTRKECVKVDESWVKDLRVLGACGLGDVVLLDNCMMSFAYQIDNGLYIPSFTGSKHDSHLLKAIKLLTHIANVPDVRPYIRKFSGIAQRLQLLKETVLQ